MKHVWRMMLVFLAAASSVNGLAALRHAAPAPGPYADVPHGSWSESAISTVSVKNRWMAPATKTTFAPAGPLTRAVFAKAVVLAFAPGAKPFDKVSFSDVPSGDPVFPYANVAAGLGWMGTTPSHQFLPAKALTKADVATVLTRALGLKAETAGLDAIATADGGKIAHARTFAPLMLSGGLRLFYNHPKDAEDLLPSNVVPRADGAYALAQAAAAKGTWRITALSGFRTITLPAMTSDRLAAVTFAFAYAGYPYIPAGEWYSPTPKGYCCGAQPQGGFDCSGFVWWVVKAPSGGYDNTAVRGYKGWSLPQRSSYDMAHAAPERVAVGDALPGDLLFSDVDGKGADWKAIDHVGLALGNGWMIHSSGPGVLIDWIGDGWWASHLRWARRLGQTGPPAQPGPGPSASPSASPSPVASPQAKKQ